MERTVGRLNIEHYKRLLETETDKTKRQMLKRLLAEEEAKLVAIVGPSKRGQTVVYAVVKLPMPDQVAKWAPLSILPSASGGYRRVFSSRNLPIHQRPGNTETPTHGTLRLHRGRPSAGRVHRARLKWVSTLASLTLCLTQHALTCLKWRYITCEAGELAPEAGIARKIHFPNASKVGEPWPYAGARYGPMRPQGKYAARMASTYLRGKVPAGAVSGGPSEQGNEAWPCSSRQSASVVAATFHKISWPLAAYGEPIFSEGYY
jgi:hypothetical protein